MSELRKAAQMALEALETASRNGSDGLKRYELKELDDTIANLRTAIAQPEPTRSQQMRDAGYTRRPRQLPEEDEQEPVAWWDGKESVVFTHDEIYTPNWTDYWTRPLYTAPPQRQPLTDQEIIEAIKHISHNEMSAFAIARAIESVLKNASSEANKGTYDNP